MAFKIIRCEVGKWEMPTRFIGFLVAKSQELRPCRSRRPFDGISFCISVSPSLQFNPISRHYCHPGTGVLAA
jgi:hypothetical protein